MMAPISTQNHPRGRSDWPRHSGRGARWVEEWKSSSRARKPFLFDVEEENEKTKSNAMRKCLMNSFGVCEIEWKINLRMKSVSPWYWSPVTKWEILRPNEFPASSMVPGGLIRNCLANVWTKLITGWFWCCKKSTLKMEPLQALPEGWLAGAWLSLIFSFNKKYEKTISASPKLQKWIKFSHDLYTRLAWNEAICFHCHGTLWNNFQRCSGHMHQCHVAVFRQIQIHADKSKYQSHSHTVTLK